ncbi:MAG: hypothetical protein P8Y70_15055 [Candidatus Lokiarchaeota archaeon]
MMTKLSDTALGLLIIGTIIVILSFFIVSIILPIVFVYLQISGWIFFAISIVLGLITRNEYHVIKLKSGFPLKLDHLIILICGSGIFFSSMLFFDILNYIYIGHFTFFSVAWLVIVFGGTLIVYYLRQGIKFKNQSKNS